MTGIELLISGWFASPIIRCVVEKAQKYVGANYDLHKGTHQLVENLTGKLEICEATVKEVGKSPIINNPALQNCLRRLKLAVYDAEDVLDNMEAKSIKEKVQGKNKVSSFASSSVFGLKNLFFPDDNHKNLKKVVDRLNQLSADIQNILKLVNMNRSNESQNHEFTDQRETISQPLEEVGLYGREEELNLILDIILDPRSESKKREGQNLNAYRGLTILPITGMGGVGKTALAQAVYNNQEVQHTFASKAWISVSCNVGAELLMRKIIQSFGGYLNLDVFTLEDISKTLCAIIAGMRFLVVLDGISEKIEYQWGVIVTILSRGAPGSVVLITTQNQEFANRVATSIHITLNALNKDIHWELFKKFAFSNLVMSEEKRKKLELIGRQIEEKLHGLPLAAKVIGNLLRSKVDEDEWRKILKSEWWNIPEGRSQILPSIALSYERLDPCYRQCFAYCSVFPKNMLIEKDRLVKLWIAQDFILPDSNGSTLEDVGSKWFDKLVEMSFFQLTGDYKGYIMSEFMHDLSFIVSSNECFYLSDKSKKIPLNVCHIAVDTENLELIREIQKCKHLRSFFYFGCCQVDGMCTTINETLRELDSIRVLDLSYLHMEKKEPPTAIQTLTHLRFLDLSSTGIEVLSNISFHYYHLQTLYLQNCQFLTLPREINRLINLRHLKADTETVALISGIGKLTNLTELNVYAIGTHEGHKVSELKSLSEITGHLKIDCCENIKCKDEAMQANLVNKKNLNSVEICWTSTRRKSNLDIEILEGLRPHEHINYLRIANYAGVSFPDWMIKMSDFTNLKIIKLYCLEKIEVLPPLGELPSLEHLELRALTSVKVIDHNFYGKKQTVFPVLTEFFCLYSYCEVWTEPEDVEFFPRITTLEYIDYTNSLRELPLQLLGASLKFLKLDGCNSLNSLEKYFCHLTSLTHLYIHSFKKRTFLNIRDLRLLVTLSLQHCPELSVQGDLQLLINLTHLDVQDCPKFQDNQQKGKGLEIHQGEGLQSLTNIDMDDSLLLYHYYQIFGKVPSLRVLVCKNSKVRRFTMSQLSWFEELTNLEELNITNCEFEHLPSNLAMMSSLKKITLNSCTKLEALPENGMPPYLWELTLTFCFQSLVQRCQPNEGQDWPLISHVPLIRVDGIIINPLPSSEGTSG